MGEHRFFLDIASLELVLHPPISSVKTLVMNHVFFFSVRYQ